MQGLEASPRPANRVVQKFEPAAERSAWLIAADEISLTPHPHEDSSDLLRLTPQKTGDPIRLRRQGSYDLESFDRVQLTLACSGETLASAAFLRDGLVVATTNSVPITQLAEVGSVEMVLPRVAAERGTATSMQLLFGDTPRSVSLESVELLATPASQLVPTGNGKGQLSRLGDEGRLGVGVSTGRPVETSFHVPPAGVLSFSVGIPPHGRWKGEPPLLIITLTDPGQHEGEELQVLEHPLARGDDQAVWTDLSLELNNFSGRDLLARFEIRGAPGQEASCVISEAVVWSRSSRKNPSLLLITTDTHRGDHLGNAVRGAGVETPNLDALGDRGVFFEDCFASANYTNPSHMALMTGLHPRDVGIFTNKQAMGQEAETLAERLRNAGYRTFAALSAHHLGDTVSGLGQGFDRMTWPDLPQRPAADTLDIVERWLAPGEATHDERPIFLWLHVFDAHRPYDPSPEWMARYYDGPTDPYDPALPELPENIVLPREMQGLRALEHPRAQYKALVSSLDEQLARVLDHPKMAEAVVAVVGDHGEQMGDHDVWFDHAELYTDTLHVPLILTWPEAPAGTRVTHPVSHLDLGRTLLDLAGETEVNFPGNSLVDKAGDANGDAPSNKARIALSSHGSSASLSQGGLHLILHLRDNHRLYDHHEVELYDLTTDPTCQNNVLSERIDEAKALRAQLVRWLSETPASSFAGAVSTDPQLLSDLARLGYTGAAPGLGDALWQADNCAWCTRME
ncbi:MAG: sulfatase [Planctomycetota bacterium]|nr:sulfatase [Planctomycetota bacterium]